MEGGRKKEKTNQFYKCAFRSGKGEAGFLGPRGGEGGGGEQEIETEEEVPQKTHRATDPCILQRQRNWYNLC